MSFFFTFFEIDSVGLFENVYACDPNAIAGIFRIAKTQTSGAATKSVKGNVSALGRSIQNPEKDLFREIGPTFVQKKLHDFSKKCLARLSRRSVSSLKSLASKVSDGIGYSV